MMAGAMLGAAGARRVVLVVDGFTASAAALVARALAPEVATVLVFAHRSSEHGHAALLDRMGAEPLLDLDMRLGEGTGALLAWPLVRAATAMLREMSSFESAGVGGPA
jgi:nicotinate-nucleotide--dimethylbenzimidazole phosphoribosyltransferase